MPVSAPVQSSWQQRSSMIVLHGQARISGVEATAAGPDLLLGVLFIAAFAKTPTWDQRG